VPGGGKDKIQKEKDVKIALNLELHTASMNNNNSADSKLSRGYNFMARPTGESKSDADNKEKADPSIPKVCAVH